MFSPWLTSLITFMDVSTTLIFFSQWEGATFDNAKRNTMVTWAMDSQVEGARGARLPCTARSNIRNWERNSSVNEQVCYWAGDSRWKVNCRGADELKYVLNWYVCLARIFATFLQQWGFPFENEVFAQVIKLLDSL